MATRKQKHEDAVAKRERRMVIDRVQPINLSKIMQSQRIADARARKTRKR